MSEPPDTASTSRPEIEALRERLRSGRLGQEDLQLLDRLLGTPESVQFERCQAVADSLLPVYLQLRELAAQGEVIFGDDTGVKILACLKENKQLAVAERRGTQTTGLVVEVEGRRIALYASGRRHLFHPDRMRNRDGQQR